MLSGTATAKARSGTILFAGQGRPSSSNKRRLLLALWNPMTLAFLFSSSPCMIARAFQPAVRQQLAPQKFIPSVTNNDGIFIMPKVQTTPSRQDRATNLYSTSTSTADEQKQPTTNQQSNINNNNSNNTVVPLYRSEGIFSVVKPLEWTSNDVVSFIRKMLEREARERGAKPIPVGSRQARRNKKRVLKVGHGGTLDPLATGVLVIGVGKGTKELQSYLSGSKKYTAEAELGFETNTLDMDPTGNVTKRSDYDHVTTDDIRNALPSFVGTISQIPPIFSAIKKDGKRLYEHARGDGKGKKGKGKAGDEDKESTTSPAAAPADIQIDAREVVVHNLELLDDLKGSKFSMDIECGGGTYVRSLIRDIAYKVDTVATMTALERTKQGQFTLENSLVKDQWSPDTIYAAIDKSNKERNADDS